MNNKDADQTAGMRMQYHRMCKLRHLLMFVTSKVQRRVMLV